MPFGDWNQADGVISVYRTIEDPVQQAAAARAAIPIERARGRVLLVCVEAEQMWPSCPMARQVAAHIRLRERTASKWLSSKSCLWLHLAPRRSCW